MLTVLDTRGSSPRNSGSKMVVSGTDSFGSIGGGALEHEAIKLSRQFLKENKTIQYTQRFNLAKDLKQCCGGELSVFFEVFVSNTFNIVIFGAGHIGKALVQILDGVDCHVKWFDSRAELFPENCASHIQTVIMDQPDLAVASCQKNSYYLVLTHDHALDQTICESILSRNDSRYCGLIGSKTKALKFKQRMQKKGFSLQELDKLNCPMGLASIKTKNPMEIAVSIVAELLGLRIK